MKFCNDPTHLKKKYREEIMWKGEHLYGEMPQRWSGMEILLRGSIISGIVPESLVTSTAVNQR